MNTPTPLGGFPEKEAPRLQTQVITHPHRWKAVGLGVVSVLAYAFAIIAWIFTGLQSEKLKNFLLLKHVVDNWNFSETKSLESGSNAPGNTVTVVPKPESDPVIELEPEPVVEPVPEPVADEIDSEIETWKGEVADFLSKLERRTHNRGSNWLDKFASWPLPHLRRLKGFLGDLTSQEARDRFLVETRSSGVWGPETVTVSPLIQFLNFAYENHDQFDFALESLNLALTAKPLGTFAEDYSNHYNLLVGEPYWSGTMREFARSSLPLAEKLNAAFAEIFKAERVIFARGANQALSAEESKRGAPIHQAYVAAVNGLKDSVHQLFFAHYIPMSEGDLVGAYNGVLENLINEINQRFRMHGYDEIDFSNVKIPSPETDTSPLNLDQSVAAISRETFFSEIDPAARFASEFCISTMPKSFVAILNRRMEKKFPGIHICGAGNTGLFFRINFQGEGTRVIRKIEAADQESLSFQSPMFGHIFERETQQNPNLSGRTIAAAKISQMMARFGCELLTVDAEVLTNHATGARYISTSDAGDQSLEQWCNGVASFTGGNIDRFIQLQGFSYVTGQCDGHRGNFVANSRTGQITSIDHGYTFPPFKFGEDAVELMENLAQNLHDYDDAWGKFTVDQIVKSKNFTRGNMPKSIMLALPPYMTPQTRDMLMRMTDGKSRAEIDKILETTGHTAKERQAAQWRLETMGKQLATVQVASKEELQRLWNADPSPFTADNCWLRRFPA
jgi:hypothetical protein